MATRLLKKNWEAYMTTDLACHRITARLFACTANRQNKEIREPNTPSVQCMNLDMGYSRTMPKLFTGIGKQPITAKQMHKAA